MRLLTIFALVTVCGFAAICGVEVAGFSAVLQGTRKDAGERILKWRDVPGISGAVIEESLRRLPFGTSPTDKQNRLDGLAQLLSVRPLSSVDWLSLAGERAASNAPNDQVISALTMSQLSDPNDDLLMLQRGMFGLLLWETLTDAARQRVIRDLAGAITGNVIPDPTASQIKEILVRKPAAARSQIETMLEAERVSHADLGRIGL